MLALRQSRISNLLTKVLLQLNPGASFLTCLLRCECIFSGASYLLFNLLIHWLFLGELSLRRVSIQTLTWFKKFLPMINYLIASNLGPGAPFKLKFYNDFLPLINTTLSILIDGENKNDENAKSIRQCLLLSLKEA